MSWVSPPPHCPACRYSWRGLSDEGRCPECGFEFDTTTSLWVPEQRRWWQRRPWRDLLAPRTYAPMVWWITGAYTLYVLACLILHSLLPHEVPMYFAGLAALLFALCLAKAALILLRGPLRYRPPIICLRGGVIEFCRDRQVDSVALVDIYDVCLEDGLLVVDVRMGRGKARSFHFVVDEQSFDAFRAEVVRRLDDPAGLPADR